MPAAHPVPIRRLTLYKHGVAFVEREGAFTGDLLALPFHGDELNDALKSLLVLDGGGPPPLGATYETPVPAEERLAGTPLRLAADHSLLDLLRALRGRAVRLTLGDGSQRREVTGRLIGLDVARKRRRPSADTLALLEDGSGVVLRLPLADLRQVQIADAQAAADLQTLLAASEETGVRRFLRLRLSPGAHDLRVSYLVPSPAWRVSYRVVADAADGDGGSLLLQGWGIFDNRFGEALDEVAVTLVAGQPISFRYDLTTSRTPQRPLVEDETRVAPGPVAFAAAMPEPLDEVATRRPAPGRAARALATAQLAGPPSPWRRESVEARPTLFAAASEQGELFAYQVAAPVTAPPDASALVPLLQATLPYRRLLLFNQAKLPDHPVAALQFVNASGLTLERGPVTVLEDGAYRGEAIIPFSRNGETVYLACAVELGVRVAVNTWMTSERVGLAIKDRLLHYRHADVAHVHFAIENTLPERRAVTLEERRDPSAELADTPTPDGRTAEHYRWEVACPARQVTHFQVNQRVYRWQVEQVTDQSYDQLAQYLARHWLDAATLERLRAILAERDAIKRNDAEGARLDAEQTQIGEREEQLRRNMAALAGAGAEGAFRETLVQRLHEAEERVATIAARHAALQADTERREATIQQQLASLESDKIGAPERSGDETLSA